MKKVICIMLSMIILCFAATTLSEAISPGDIITLGHYEQDNNPDNGPEPIEWMVLDTQDGKALLLSKYGLDMKPYNTELEDITWETCTLRAWLNSDFLESAFSTEEQSAILATEVDNNDAQGYSDWNTTGGNNTQDRLFLLSYNEANRYLGVKYVLDDNSENVTSRVAPTDYAIAQGAWVANKQQTTEDKPSGWWWLRSPGEFQIYVGIVISDGSFSGTNLNFDHSTVRPALWLDLNSGIF